MTECLFLGELSTLIVWLKSNLVYKKTAHRLELLNTGVELNWTEKDQSVCVCVWSELFSAISGDRLP